VSIPALRRMETRL